MATSLLLLTIAAFVLLISSAIDPKFYNRLVKRNFGRKQWVAVFSSAAIIFFILFAISLPPANNDSTPEQTGQDQAEQVTEEEQQPLYEEITTLVAQNIRAYNHYIYLGDSKPSKEEVQKIMAELAHQECDYPRCDYLLWDSMDAYNEQGTIDGRLAHEIASEHKEHLAGYMNNAMLFFYYGSTGDGVDEHSQTLYDQDTDEYFDS